VLSAEGPLKESINLGLHRPSASHSQKDTDTGIPFDCSIKVSFSNTRIN